MRRLVRQNLEGERQQRIAGQNRGRLVESLVHGRPAAAQVVIVHRRQVVMHQRIAVQQLDGRACASCPLGWNTEKPCRLDRQEGPQPLAAAEGAMPHRRDQTRRSSEFARNCGIGQQGLQQRLDGGCILRQPGIEIAGVGRKRDGTHAQVSRSLPEGGALPDVRRIVKLRRLGPGP